MRYLLHSKICFCIWLGISASLTLASCTQKKKLSSETASQSAPQSQFMSVSNALNRDLIGSWSACETSHSDTLNISGITNYQIKDDTHMTVTFSYFTDALCQTPFRQADAVQGVVAWEAFYKETAGNDVKDYYQSLVTGFSQDSTLEASLAKPGETGTFDQTTNFETAFLSYKIVDKKLYVTEACLPSEIILASTTNCKIIGDTPENRSTDFSQIVPLIRN